MQYVTILNAIIDICLLIRKNKQKTTSNILLKLLLRYVYTCTQSHYNNTNLYVHMKEPINNNSFESIESYFEMIINISNKVDRFLFGSKIYNFFLWYRSWGRELREHYCFEYYLQFTYYKVVKKQIFFYRNFSIVLQLGTRICSLNNLKKLCFQRKS